MNLHCKAVPWRGRRDLTTGRCGHVQSLAFDISSDHVSAHVRLTGSVTADTTQDLGKVLASLIRAGHRTLVVELGDVAEFSPVAAGVLNRASSRLAQSGGSLMLSGVAVEIATALRSAGLDTRIELAIDGRPRRGAQPHRLSDCRHLRQ